MSRNVHKEDVTIVKLPQDAIQEDRGLNTCGVPQLVLASISDVISYKNDRTAIAYKFDTMTVELEDSNGVVTPAAGIAVSFPHQPDAVGFVIDWRQVLDGGGDLAQGCYRVRVNWTLAGNSDWFYHGAYQLREYSTFNARGTTRLYVVLNDLVRKQGINYKDSGFAGTVRFEGIFGYMQPNYDTENNTHTDRTRHKVRNEAIRTYELRTSYLLKCMTRLIDEETLLAANQIYVTDHNAGNHDQSIYDFPVILDENESPSFEYPVGSVYAKITAKFLDKRAVHESKYDGNIAGSENVILELPSAVSSCPVATVTLDSASFLTVPSGSTTDAKLVDQNDVTISPISIISGVIKVDQTPPPQRNTAKIMQTGQSSFITGDAGDNPQGRDVDFVTLESVPLHDDESPTINTTTNRFTDEFGGQTYTIGIILDWSTWDGAELLGWQNNFQLGVPVVGGSGYMPLTTAIAYCNAFTLGGFSGWHQCNFFELASVAKDEIDGFNYAPFNSTLVNYLWTNSTLNTTIARRYRQDISAWELPTIAGNNANPFPCRYFSLSTSNVLS